MCVPEHGGDAAVEPVRERDLLARRLGVDVDDDDSAGALRLLDERVDRLEQVVGDVRKSEPMTLITATGVPSVGVRDGEPAAGRRGGEVRRAGSRARSRSGRG